MLGDLLDQIEQHSRPDNRINVVNTFTGEVMSYEWSDDYEMAQAYASIQETIKALERAKEKIRNRIIDKVDDKLEVGNDFIWHKTVKRYRNYDLSTMRQRLDEDLFNQLVKPNKSKIDELIKDSIEAAPHTFILDPDVVDELRATMIEERTPSIAISLERIKHEGK